MTILLIIVICFICYHSGIFKKLIKAATLEKSPPHMQPEKAPTISPAKMPELERRKLEIIAANITLYENGGDSSYNIWKQVNKLTDNELITIINDFKNEIEL